MPGSDSTNKKKTMSDIKQILFPFAHVAEQRVLANGSRFAYYTTADTALKIIQSESVWMRSTRTMNDFMEVEHGIDCVVDALKSPGGLEFAGAINAIYPGLFDQAHQHYSHWIPGFQADTFVTCLSEHAPDEDRYGRLSMWRAYGGRAGVALILNGAVMFSETDALAAYSSPVFYASPADVAAGFSDVARSIATNSSYVKSIGRDDFNAYLFQMLRYATVCTKHPAFSEEREWRIVASPSVEPSKLVSSATEVVGGVPQTVLKIPLKNEPEFGLHGLAIPQLLDRILIGPTEYPDVIRRALATALEAAGVKNAQSRITLTNIPLREPQK